MIKNSVLEGFQSEISTTQIVVTMGITMILAIYIFFIYRLNSKSQFYSKDFNKTLAVISVVTAAIVLAIQSNLVISLGMVGALSIVRFRTAIKNPVDLLFLFWSISIGIVCGAGMYEIALLASVVVTMLLFLVDLISLPKAPYLLVLNSNCKDIEKDLMKVLEIYCKRVTVKSRNRTLHGINYVIELYTQKEKELTQACEGLEGVTAVSLLLHDGELRY